MAMGRSVSKCKKYVVKWKCNNAPKVHMDSMKLGPKHFSWSGHIERDIQNLIFASAFEDIPSRSCFANTRGKK
jgi:hypothetical protein